MNFVKKSIAALRHRALRGRLQRMRRPRRIVVVCYANICRSPYLAALLRRALPDVDVSSAGFTGLGHRVPEHSKTVATQHGIDLSAHRSRLLTGEILLDTDLVVVMDDRQARAIERRFHVPASRIVIAGDLDPLPAETREIRDPWNQSLEVFKSSFARLERCADSLVRLLDSRF